MSTIEYVGDSGPDGTIVGKTATALVAFHGATPVDQRAFTAGVGTSTPITGTTAGAVGFTATQGAAIIALLNEIQALLVEKGLMAAS